ncbi:MAG TPA: ABC transporter substrate-binding protein [Egibacteraceae bacterium]|jgi:osmoprotectant transport system substrate-binding protein|nr:ABC transporter substrate-binding protein [Egibacteraceae bacterium]
MGHRTGPHRVLGALVGLALLLAACAGDDPLGQEAPGAGPDTGADPGTITVGSADFPEALLLGNIAAGALEARGFDVETQLNLGSREIYFPAMRNGEIDVLMEYAGALLSHLTGGTDSTDVDAIMEELRAELEDEGIAVLDPSPAENRNALVVTPETAEQYDLSTVSDLAPVGGELVLGGPPEYRTRRIGLPGLEEVYGIEFASFRDLDAGGVLTIAALEQGDIDVGVLFTTQGVIDDKGWVVLEEDRPLIPAENIIPVVRQEAATDEVRAVLDEVAAALSTEDLVELNRRMEVDREDPEVVAEDWLTEQGFLE